MDARWWHNEATEMHDCKLSVGLGKLKLRNFWALEKLQSHSAIAWCDSYVSLVLSNLPRVSVTRRKHAKHEAIVKSNLSIILPFIFTMLDLLSFPATLSAVHVYCPLSSPSASLITNEPSSWTLYFPPLGITRPSFVHVTVGFGTPLAGHLIVMLVLVSAVTLSPIIIVIGLRWWAFTVFDSLAVPTLGSECSRKETWTTRY